MKKRVLFYAILFLGLTTVSQSLSSREITKLNKLSIEVQRLDLNTLDIQKDLHLIFKCSIAPLTPL